MEIAYICRDVKINAIASSSENTEFKKAFRSQEPIQRREFGDGSYIIVSYSIIDLLGNGRFFVEVVLRSFEQTRSQSRIEAFIRLMDIADDHLRRYRVMAAGDMYWSGRRDEAGYFRDNIRYILQNNEIELPEERLAILESWRNEQRTRSRR